MFKRMIAGLILILMWVGGTVELDAAQVGIKYNRPKSEYPDKALADFKRFSDDRIKTVMICLPWSQWEPVEGKIDQEFISQKLAPVLKLAEANGMKIIISSHCSFWGTKGDRTIPRWVKAKPGFGSSTSALTHPLIRSYHTSYLIRLIKATRDFSSVQGFSLLNEPVAATKFYLTKAKTEFDARWEGVLDIISKVKKYKEATQLSQYLIIGQHGADTGYGHYVWKNTDKYDLTLLWTQWLDKISAQGLVPLQESMAWYPERPKIRTEGVLTFALLKARSGDGNLGRTKTQWSQSKDYGAAVYDYDLVYEYEGEGNATIPKLEAFYSWRIGSPDGSSKHLTFLDHRRGDRPTPYYWALRDLAAGVDSFETIDPSGLPINRKATLIFNPDVAKPGISRYWLGSGKIVGQREILPNVAESTFAAKVMLKPKQSVFREVVASHWRDSGVKESDAFCFWGKVETPFKITLIVRLSEGELQQSLSLTPGWNYYRISFQSLGITRDKIPSIRSVGFVNETLSEQTFFLDEFLIRP